MRLNFASHAGSTQARRSRRKTASRHDRPLTALVTALAAAAAVAAGVLPRLPVPAAWADEVTASANNLRTGWDPAEPGLEPAADSGPVGGPGFGELFEAHLKGQVYGQPVVAGKVLIVVTETDHVYGLNAVTGTVEWSRYFGPAEPWTAVSCHDLTPSIGITSAPVYDPASGTVYLTAVVDNGPTQAQPHTYVYALNAKTGATRTGWPVAIHGSPVNDPSASFNPLSERQRAGLLLLNGWVYMAFGSYCDFQPYAGYVAGVRTTSRAITLWSDEAGLTDSQGGIWQAGGGLMSDGAGRIFVATGNGVSPAPGPGTSPPPDLGDAVVRLSVAANGTLSAADYFSPANAPTLDANDTDFGSGGPVGLPFGTSTYPDLLVQAGKDGRVFLLDRNALGGREQGAGSTDDAVSQSGPYGGQWGHPAVFGPDATVSAATSGDYVYYVGSDDVLRYLQFGVSASGTPVLTDVANTSTTFGYSSGSPVVTSDGDDAASAVVWEVDAPSAYGRGASLQAFAAAPASTCSSSAPCTMAPIWSAPIGTASKFTIPATDSGRVYVGTRDGTVFGFGSPDLAPLAGTPADFGQVAVGRSAPAKTVTMTASASVTVTGLSVAQPSGQTLFRLGKADVDGAAARFPVTLSPGETLTAPVTFTPSRAGGVTGAVLATTSAPNFPAVSVSLTGQGTAPGLQASTSAVSFRRVPVGRTVGSTVLVSNGSRAAETITSASAPGAPFRARLPASGRALAPGQSVAVPITFRPTGEGASSSSFRIVTSGRHVLTVRLTGTGKKAVSRLSALHALVSFGAVHLGSRATQTIVITNDGNLPALISQATGPAVPFGAQVNAPAGLPVSPGYTVTVPVTFAPTSPGPVTGEYRLRWRDAEGSHLETIRLAGTGVTPASGRAVPPPGGGWTVNGSAAMRGQNLVMTSTARYAAGSAVYAVPQRTSDLTVKFTATLAGDGGMTLALLPAGTASTRALGGNGGRLGFGSLPGVAVTLATARFAGEPSGSFIGVATSTAGARLHYLASTAAIPSLRTGSHRVAVTVRGRTVRVSVDGRPVLSALLGASTLPAQALIGLTGATGSRAGSQDVSHVTITAGAGSSVPGPGGGWSYNGSAAMSGSMTLLTRAVQNQAGAVVYPVALPTSGLKVTFTAQLYGGSGASGLAFALLNPASSDASSVGADGGSDGFGGLGGVAVVLDTIQQNSFSTSNVAEISASTAGGTGITLLHEAEIIPPLRVGPQTVTVDVSSHSGGYVMTVRLDGEQILQWVVPGLTSTSMLAFTAATGTQTDIHLVRDVAISAAS
jgi:Abnormal spindle-like microcephaly-assoc'd, ASPM-SPD-2-Hydin